MDSSRPRRLAAVWFADIVGYSALSSKDEDAALDMVRSLQDAARAEAEAHGGRVVKFVGDAALVVFESVDGALRAALGVQRRFSASAEAQAHELSLRIGLHLGEITEAPDGDIYGDGVNVAARLQTKARPGDVLVSRVVTETTRGRAGYVFAGLPAWYYLKGLGFTRAFIVTDVDAPPRPRRRLPARAIGFGLAAGVAGFFLLLSNVAMDSDGVRAPVPLTEEAIEDGSVRLNLGMEHYFAGELEDAEEALRLFIRPPLADHPAARRALRYLARAQHEAGHDDRARATLVRMVASEPPMALLIPSAEEDGLMSLYYEARRAALRSRVVAAPLKPVRQVILFDLEVVLDGKDEGEEGASPEDLGATMAKMLGSELEAAGIATQYFWEISVGLSGERAYRQFGADADPLTRGETHALLGRVALRGGEVAVSTQVYDLATGELVSTEILTGAWPEGFLEVVERLGAAVARDLLGGGE